MRPKFLVVLGLIALLLRFLLIPNPGFEADVSFWKSWGLAVFDKGIVEGIKVTNNNYPTPFTYVLGLMIKLYSFFADPHNFNEFWQNSNLLFLTISKMFPILADLGIAAFILWFTSAKSEILNPKQYQNPNDKNSKRGRVSNLELGAWDLFRIWNLEIRVSRLGAVLALVYLLSPISLADGAWWGQVDSLGVFVFLIAFLLALKRQPFWAGLVFMLSMMTKLQNMIYGPLFFLFLWQLLGFEGLLKAAAGATLAFFGLNIEFLLSRNMDRVMASLTSNYDYFPWMSLNAYNLWWIVTGARGMMTSDKLAVLGIVNAKTVGLLMFSSFYLFAVLRQIAILLNCYIVRKPQKQFSNLTIQQSSQPTTSGLLQAFLESLIIVNAAFFLFMTQSHDRYLFPVSVFLLLWAPLNAMKHDGRRWMIDMKQLRVFSIFYLLFSLFYFYNLHTALVINYPKNGLTFLSSLIQPLFTITTAIVLLTLFGVFLYIISRSSKPTFYLLSSIFAIFIAVLSVFNRPLLTKQPVSLTKLTPFISEQAYGSRQTNRTVQSSFGGPNSWTRLSVQYAFYKEGIGTHAASRHVFDINRKFKRISADYGIDTEAGTRATAVFEIWGDDKLLFRSEKMGRFDLPKHAEVDVSGIKNLTLITTDAGDGNFDDHTDWLNPKLWP